MWTWSSVEDRKCSRDRELEATRLMTLDRGVARLEKREARDLTFWGWEMVSHM